MKRDALFHPYAQGPKGENVGSITQPLPSNYLIFRAASESDGELYVWWLFVVYEHNLMFMNIIYSRRSFPSLICALSLQVGAGWMPWSYLSAAPVSTSWQPKPEEKQISARLQSPPIYSTCCSLPHSVIQSCYSKQCTHTAAHTESLLGIIYLYLTYIGCCYWMIYINKSCVSFICNH